MIRYHTGKLSEKNKKIIIDILSDTLDLFADFYITKDNLRLFIRENEDKWRVADEVKNMVLFRRLNFMRENFPFNKKFHSIFCRNVMIYFDPETRKKLVSRFSRYMEKNVYFYIGLSESLGRTNNYFKYIKPGVYQNNGQCD